MRYAFMYFDEFFVSTTLLNKLWIIFLNRIDLTKKNPNKIGRKIDSTETEVKYVNKENLVKTHRLRNNNNNNNHSMRNFFGAGLGSLFQAFFPSRAGHIEI